MRQLLLAYRTGLCFLVIVPGAFAAHSPADGQQDEAGSEEYVFHADEGGDGTAQDRTGHGANLLGRE